MPYKKIAFLFSLSALALPAFAFAFTPAIDPTSTTSGNEGTMVITGNAGGNISACIFYPSGAPVSSGNCGVRRANTDPIAWSYLGLPTFLTAEAGYTLVVVNDTFDGLNGNCGNNTLAHCEGVGYGASLGETNFSITAAETSTETSTTSTAATSTLIEEYYRGGISFLFFLIATIGTLAGYSYIRGKKA